MKANGILTHVYLIYGWPGQDEQELVDSMETVRQLFAAGLVDSAFWHKFILTRHSPIYREWKAGARPGLRVIEQAWTFGSNDLSFVGEELLARFGPGLDAALGAWMQAEEIERPPSAWFPFRVPKTTVPADRVERLARAARRAVDARPAGRGKRAAWLGGALVQEPAREGSVRLSWSYRNTVHAVVMDPGPARTLIACLQEARTMDEILERMNGGDAPAFESTPAFRRLRRAGLAAY
jgi:hypothetical protein